MSRRLRLTPQAETDLLAIWRHIADDSPTAADRFLGQLRDKSELLLAFPKIGRRWRLSGERRVHSAGLYLIIYRETPDGILVLRYIHGRRDLRQVEPE